MKNPFDEVISREDTNSLKYDFKIQRGKQQDILPMWVADMDLRAPQAVSRRIEKLAKHNIYGYSEAGDSYYEALKKWMLKHHSWQIERSWVVKTPGVVFAIAMAVRALTEEGDSVLVQQPVYYPFSEVVLDNDRKLIVNELVYKNGKYGIDFNDFENKIKKEKVKLFLLCNPHNPVGRVWSKEELLKIGEICLKYNVRVISDEIHQDFVYTGHCHYVFANLNDAIRDMTITCTAPSKTFNLAGLQVSNILISNSEIRRKFKKEIAKTGYSQLNVAGLVAAEAAYTDGEAWLNEVKSYIEDNLAYLREFLKQRIPNVKLVEPEGTYLVWLDFRKLNLSEEERKILLEEKAKLWLDTGTMFGESGVGFERINIACPRQILQKALESLENALK